MGGDSSIGTSSICFPEDNGNPDNQIKIGEKAIYDQSEKRLISQHINLTEREDLIRYRVLNNGVIFSISPENNSFIIPAINAWEFQIGMFLSDNDYNDCGVSLVSTFDLGIASGDYESIYSILAYFYTPINLTKKELERRIGHLSFAVENTNILIEQLGSPYIFPNPFDDGLE